MMAEKEKTFEEKLEKIEEIIRQMESGNLPLEQMLKHYEEAQKLINDEIESLNAAKAKINEFRK